MAIPGKNVFFQGFYLTGHFIVAFSVGGGGIKWPFQVKMCFFQGFYWTGHFIEAFSVGGGGIKWPFQVKMCFFRAFTWTGHFIEKKISLEKFLRVNGVLGAPRARAPKRCQNWSHFGARARAARPGPLSPQGPLSKESVLEAFSVGGGGIKWPVQHRFCFTRFC